MHKELVICTFDHQRQDLGISHNLVHVPGPKKWLILGVSLTHLVEGRDLFFS